MEIVPISDECFAMLPVECSISCGTTYLGPVQQLCLDSGGELPAAVAHYKLTEQQEWASAGALLSELA